MILTNSNIYIFIFQNILLFLSIALMFSPQAQTLPGFLFFHGRHGRLSHNFTESLELSHFV